jgi:hypothetical protein
VGLAVVEQQTTLQVHSQVETEVMVDMVQEVPVVEVHIMARVVPVVVVVTG